PFIRKNVRETAPLGSALPDEVVYAIVRTSAGIAFMVSGCRRTGRRPRLGPGQPEDSVGLRRLRPPPVTRIGATKRFPARTRQASFVLLPSRLPISDGWIEGHPRPVAGFGGEGC